MRLLTWWISISNHGVMITEADCCHCAAKNAERTGLFGGKTVVLSLFPVPEEIGDDMREWLKAAPRDTLILPSAIPSDIGLQVSTDRLDARRRNAAMN